MSLARLYPDKVLLAALVANISAAASYLTVYSTKERVSGVHGIILRSISKGTSLVEAYFEELYEDKNSSKALY